MSSEEHIRRASVYGFEWNLDLLMIAERNGKQSITYATIDVAVASTAPETKSRVAHGPRQVEYLEQARTTENRVGPEWHHASSLEHGQDLSQAGRELISLITNQQNDHVLSCGWQRI
jgi:hypothetical protein